MNEPETVSGEGNDTAISPLRLAVGRVGFDGSEWAVSLVIDQTTLLTDLRVTASDARGALSEALSLVARGLARGVGASERARREQP